MKIELRREDFINQYPPLNFLNKDEVSDIWEKEDLHLYVHIPYCTKKCGFCYYKSVSVGNNPVPENYMEALRKEIKMYASVPQIQSKKIKSVYFGGGTPTLLSINQLETLIKTIQSSFEFDSNYEFCCEARPGNETSREKLEMLKQYGLKRLSLGCQSLNDDVLVANGRNHKSEEFYKTFKLAREVGIDSINVDLMSGLVNQTMGNWLDTIDKIIDLKPENVAIYKLEVYLNNDLYKKYRGGKIQLISDAEEAEYARQAYNKLMDSGYILADNFSFTTSSEYYHLHRREVWEGSDMLGIGASAHSCFNDFLFQNEIRIDDYIRKVNSGESTIVRAHKISKQEDMVQRVIFGLKNIKYNREDFRDEFGVDVMDVFGDKLRMLEEEGFVIITDDTIGLTFEGAIFADDIVRELYMPEHKKMILAHVKRSIS